MEAPEDVLCLEVAGQEVRVTHPDKLIFPRLGLRKIDLVHYYLDVAEGAVRGVRDRPMLLKRFPEGADVAPFYQKHAPTSHPEWVKTILIRLNSGNLAEQIVLNDAAALAWVINLGCIDLNPWPIRAADLDHPDELRVDLDPGEASNWSDIAAVALVTRAVLKEQGLAGFPKTSGSRGMHIHVPIEPRWSFNDVRRAAVALARAVERRQPALATASWWKEERLGRVFLDYNQNSRDRTLASAYSVRPVPDARVACPLRWDDVPTIDPSTLTLFTVPQRLATQGDPAAERDLCAGQLDGLLDLAAQDEAAGLPDAPWPPHFAKAAGEAPRVAPSRRRKT